ncbi:carbon-nitrogen hydrolase family protein [Skermania sp. ID1734]|uniref:carbon-nitrogen hydrolase family protein n=1 Tax=Skermania sp. ID1734 TaxID=2597516 RepID=UPI00117F1172|nr:carbon-nitrogen hydrolase family protein [Skermania sp. ID1734]TSE01865.1 carbon-nitrogen hydrolase family protein [Skermania sp. ID1734]
MDIAVTQFAASTEKTENLSRIRSLAEVARERGARMVVAPEFSMFTAAKLDHRMVDAAEPLDGPFVTGLRDLARELDIHVVAGVLERTEAGERAHNTLVAIASDGEIVALYRKLHLYDAFGFRESDVIAAGELVAPQTFTVDDLVFGMQTCYDLRFPEVTRTLVDVGAQVVLLPAQWVPGPLKEDHWTTLLRARAIENTVYVVAADQCAPCGSGHSMIVDPMGIVVANLGERTGTTQASVEADRVAEVRKRNPALELRRYAVVPRSREAVTPSPAGSDEAVTQPSPAE